MAEKHEVIGEEWRDRSRELADWAMDGLVNRKDVWGQYSPLSPAEQKKTGRKSKVMTLPQKSMRGEDMVTLDKLARHFASLPHQQQIIGLHAKSRESTSRWFSIDIDLHDAGAADAELRSQRNFLGALVWWEKLGDMGYDPLLIDSNGMGGFHLTVLLAAPAPTKDVYAFAQDLVADWEAQGLYEEPETFPKSPGKADSLGSWLRLPGLHHSRKHYSRIWSGEEWLDDPWLHGNAAIDALLNNLPGPPPPDGGDLSTLLGKEKSAERKSPSKKASTRKARFAPTARPKVCVDLDGVLAQSIPWEGPEIIGEPVDGAVEFTRQLTENAEIIILTARLSRCSKKAESLATEKAIRSWLEKHGFSFDSIHTGSSKPPAAAYIDDRAIPCRPADEGAKAFRCALREVKAISGNNTD